MNIYSGVAPRQIFQERLIRRHIGYCCAGFLFGNATFIWGLSWFEHKQTVFALVFVLVAGINAFTDWIAFVHAFKIYFSSFASLERIVLNIDEGKINEERSLRCTTRGIYFIFLETNRYLLEGEVALICRGNDCEKCQVVSLFAVWQSYFRKINVDPITVYFDQCGENLIIKFSLRRIRTNPGKEKKWKTENVLILSKATALHTQVT